MGRLGEREMGRGGEREMGTGENDKRQKTKDKR